MMRVGSNGQTIDDGGVACDYCGYGIQVDCVWTWDAISGDGEVLEEAVVVHFECGDLWRKGVASEVRNFRPISRDEIAIVDVAEFKKRGQRIDQ